MTSRTPRRRPAAGFTLVELLVVIGIIALLISILLPTLGAARKSAKKVVCAGQNLRSIGQTTHMFANDNNGFVPHGQATPGAPWWVSIIYGGHFVQMIEKYDMSTPANFTCPETLSRTGTAFDNETINVAWNGFGETVAPTAAYQGYPAPTEQDLTTYEEVDQVWSASQSAFDKGLDGWPMSGMNADLGSYHTSFGRYKFTKDPYPYEVDKLITKTRLDIGTDDNPVLMADRLMWQKKPADPLKMLFNHGNTWEITDFAYFDRDWPEGPGNGSPMDTIQNMEILSDRGDPSANVLYADGHVVAKGPTPKSYHGIPTNEAYFWY